MRKILLIAAAIALLSSGTAFTQVSDIITKEIQESFTPKSALDTLKAGNTRFIINKMVRRNLINEAVLTAGKQHPFAVILGCMDSRAVEEYLFDAGIGSIFNIRVAGNIVNEDIIGSVEYACKAVGAKLIVVLGHSNCGAVKGACDDVKMGELTKVLEKIMPAVNSVKESGDRTSKNHEFVEEVSKANVIQSVNEIRQKSSILNEMISKGEIGIIGAMYNLETGEVTFYED